MERILKQYIHEKNMTIKDLINLWALCMLKKGPVNDGKTCLNDDQIIGYAKNTLTEEERKNVYVHISKCITCFEIIEDYYDSSNSETIDNIDEELKKMKRHLYNPTIDQEEKTKPYYIIILIIMLNIIRRYKYIALVFLGFFSFFPAGYYIINLNKPSTVITSIPDNIKRLPFERNRKSFSFIDINNTIKNKRAFAAGAWHKRKTIFENKDYQIPYEFLSPGWPEEKSIDVELWKEQSGYASIYTLGEYIFEIRIAIRQNKPDNYWKQQQNIFSDIYNNFKQHANKNGINLQLVNQRLDDIKQILNNSQQGYLNPKQRSELDSKLFSLMKNMSP